MYYGRETRIIVNHYVNESYTQFLLKVDAPPQDVVLQLDIAETFFKTIIPNVRKFLISEGV